MLRVRRCLTRAALSNIRKSGKKTDIRKSRALLHRESNNSAAMQQPAADLAERNVWVAYGAAVSARLFFSLFGPPRNFLLLASCPAQGLHHRLTFCHRTLKAVSRTGKYSGVRSEKITQGEKAENSVRFENPSGTDRISSKAVWFWEKIGFGFFFEYNER